MARPPRPLDAFALDLATAPIPLDCARKPIAHVMLNTRAWFCLIIMVAATLPIVAMSPLEAAVLSAVREAGFDEVYDFGPANEDRSVPPGSDTRIAHTPNVDVAVIQLDEHGHQVACANVLLSRDYPDGQVVKVDSNTSARAVRFRRWDIDRWNGGTFEPGTGHQLTEKGWTHNPPLTAADDIAPGRTNVMFQFMAPYPASLFKVMVAFHIGRMVDAGIITLDTPITYSVADAEDETRALRNWMDPMITLSDNRATRALLQMLHQRDHMDALSQEFRELGLDTLQINGTRASDGYGWQPGRIHMTALDTARLLWLIDGAPGELWRGANGKPVTAEFLSDTSRTHLKQLLGDQALNEALSTSNLPGVAHVQAGIPSVVAPRWIDPSNGIVQAHGINFGVDVRASNARAEVTFAHKSGMTYNYGSDAGIVRSLPGQPFRHYIIAILTNLGYRYVDEVFADRTRGPYADPVSPISYTQRIPGIGLAIDNAVKALSAQ